MKMYINNYPIAFDLEREQTALDVAVSISEWSRERDLIFMGAEIDDDHYPVNQVPAVPLDQITSINCLIQSKADIVTSSIAEGTAYCQKVVDFMVESATSNTVNRESVRNLAAGIDWLVDVLFSVFQLTNLNTGEIRYKDRTVNECSRHLIAFKKFIEVNQPDEELIAFFREQGDVFSAVINIFKMVLFSENMKDLIEHTIDSPDKLIESINRISSELPKQLSMIDEIVNAFQMGNDAEATAKLNDFTEFMFRYIRTCHQLAPVFDISFDEIVVDDRSLQEVNGKLHNLFNDVISVMENNDIISLTDIFEYEIRPIMENLDHYLDGIRSLISNGQ